jgi:hypothetical protein
MTAVSEHVARGDALLDAKIPGWAERINLATLALSDCERCIVGQLYAAATQDEDDDAYTVGLTDLGINDDEVTYGFDGINYPELTAEWKPTFAAATVDRLDHLNWHAHGSAGQSP